jgi:hypothetical protein
MNAVKKGWAANVLGALLLMAGISVDPETLQQLSSYLTTLGIVVSPTKFTAGLGLIGLVVNQFLIRKAQHELPPTMQGSADALNKQLGIVMPRLNVILLLVMLSMLLLPFLAHSATPPAPIAPAAAKLLASWTNPTTRTDTAPLAASEIKQANIYITSLASVITVPAVSNVPATSYTYALPAGVCVKTTDSIAVTVTDTGGLESAASNVWKPAADICGPKSLPNPPTGVAATAG